MQQEPLDGKPATTKPSDQALLNAYYQEPVKQAERFADLAKGNCSRWNWRFLEFTPPFCACLAWSSLPITALYWLRLHSGQ